LESASKKFKKHEYYVLYVDQKALILEKEARKPSAFIIELPYTEKR